MALALTHVTMTQSFWRPWNASTVSTSASLLAEEVCKKRGLLNGHSHGALLLRSLSMGLSYGHVLHVYRTHMGKHTVLNGLQAHSLWAAAITTNSTALPWPEGEPLS